jgi:hypothetical protein
MNDQDLDTRIRAALHAAVDDLTERDLRPALPPQAVPARRHAVRWAAPLLAAAAVVAVVVTSFVVSSGTQSARHGVPPAGSFAPTPTGKATPDQSAEESRAAAAASEAASKAALRARLAQQGQQAEQQLLGYEPLWPFATPQQARQVNGQTGPSWHFSAAQTALNFVRDYLKFSDITAVTSTQVTAKDAHIGVGYPSPGGQPHTAAVLHLLRFGDDATNASAPWEVVAATASDFSLINLTRAEAPGQLLTVQGQITGVDENIAVTLQTLGGDVRTHAAVPAGGTDSPWSVAVHSDLRGVITVVASTGGHTTAHERFVVSGIKVT